jgi:hypothetical protein
MSLTTTELWTAAGVVVAALVGGSGLGYYFGRDSASAELESLRNTLATEKLTSEIDTQNFLSRLQQLATEMGQKEEMAKANEVLAGKVRQKEAKLKTTEDQIVRYKAKVNLLQSKIQELTEIVEAEYTNIDTVIVKENATEWVIPNKVAVNLSQSMNSSVHLTVTDTLTGEWVDLGERVVLKYGDGNCSIIPTNFVGRAIRISVTCLRSQ